MRRGGRLFLLLGILILVAAALAYFVLSQPQSPSPDLVPTPTLEIKKKIVVARIDIPANTILTDTETFLGVIDIPESEFKAAPGQFFESPNDLLNKQTVRQILAAAGFEPADSYQLTRDEGNHTYTSLDDEVPLHQDERFTALFVGTTPTS